MSGPGGRPSLFAFIQLDQALTEQVQAEFAKIGAQVLGPHGDFHKIKLTRQSSSVEGVIALPFVRWLGLPSAAQKIDLGLAALLADASSPNRLPLLVNVFDEDGDGLSRRALEDIGLIVGNWDPELLAYRVVARSQPDPGSGGVGLSCSLSNSLGLPERDMIKTCLSSGWTT